MQKYSCQFCNYSVNKKSSWDKHLTSKKHTALNNGDKVEKKESTPTDSDEFLSDEEKGKSQKLLLLSEHSPSTLKVAISEVKNMNLFNCKYCNRQFTRKSSLTRHLDNHCSAKIRIDCKNEAEVEKLKTLLEVKDNAIEDKNKQINFLANELKVVHYNTKDQMSVFKTLITMYKDNLPCKSIHCQLTANFKLQHMETQEMLNDLYAPSPEVTIVVPIDDFFYHKDHRNLDIYIGQKLVEEYRKKEPKNQSIWSSDVARLVFIIRVQTETGVAWFKDKGGNKTKELIVDSILKEIEEALNFYITYVDEHKYEFGSSKLLTYVQNQMKAVEILDDITHGDLARGIMRYIAPFFAFQNELTN